MKRAILLFIILVLIICTSACGPVKKSDVNSNNSPAEEPLMSYEVTYCNARTYTNSIGTVWVQTIIEITNTGETNLYMGGGTYDLEDSSGNLVATSTSVSTFPNVLAPGEKGYLYEEKTLNDAVEGELTVIPREDIEKATVDLIRYSITETKLSNGKYRGLEMIGRIENTTQSLEDGFIYVVAFLYNQEGICIGEMFTIISEDLAPGDKIGFTMTDFSLPNDIKADDIADYVVYAFPRQYQLD